MKRINTAARALLLVLVCSIALTGCASVLASTGTDAGEQIAKDLDRAATETEAHDLCAKAASDRGLQPGQVNRRHEIFVSWCVEPAQEDPPGFFSRMLEKAIHGGLIGLGVILMLLAIPIVFLMAIFGMFSDARRITKG